MEMHRQGDLLFIKLDTGTMDYHRHGHGRGQNLEGENGTVVLARGEVTGHAHRIDANSVKRATQDEVDKLFLEITQDVEVTHEEHAPINLPAGAWQVQLQREADGPLDREETPRPRFRVD